MDPKANLAEQREIAARMIKAADLGETERDLDEFYADAVRLAELVQALDEWRQSGGYDPYAP